MKQVTMLSSVVLLIFLGFAKSDSALPLQVVKHYFKTANIGHITLLVCSSQYEKVRNVKSLNNEGFSISFSLERVSVGSQRTGALLDISCPFNYKESVVWFSDQLVEWLVYGESGNMTIDLIPALPDSSVSVLRDDVVFDVYRPSLSEPMIINNYTSTVRNHNDFRGVTLNAAQIGRHTMKHENEEPEILFGDFECLSDEEGGWNTFLSLPLVQNLADSLNFSIIAIEPNEPGCRALDKMLKEKSVVFSLTALMLTHKRLDYMAFSTHLFEIKNRILYKQPSLSTMSNIYVLPFDTNVWTFCLLTFFLAVLVMCFAQRAGGAFEEPIVTPADMFTLVIGFVCQQGTELSPKSLTVRTTIVIFAMCALFLYTSYSANIVALLQSSSPTVVSLTALASSPLSLALHDTMYNKISLQESTDEDVHLLLQKKYVNEKSYITAEEGIRRVRQGDTAFGVETSRGYKLISKQFEEPEKCDLSELKMFSLPAISLPLVKMSGYREQFSRRLTLQVECGLVSRVKKQQIEEKPHCSSMESGYVSVGFADFKPALLVLMYGVAASFLAFVLEIVMARLRKEKPLQFEKI